MQTDYKLFNRQNQPTGVRQQQQKVLDNPQNKAFRATGAQKLRGLPNNKIHSEEVYDYEQNAHGEYYPEHQEYNYEQDQYDLPTYQQLYGNQYQQSQKHHTHHQDLAFEEADYGQRYSNQPQTGWQQQDNLENNYFNNYNDPQNYYGEGANFGYSNQRNQMKYGNSYFGNQQTQVAGYDDGYRDRAKIQKIQTFGNQTASFQQTPYGMTFQIPQQANLNQNEGLPWNSQNNRNQQTFGAPKLANMYGNIKETKPGRMGRFDIVNDPTNYLADNFVIGLSNLNRISSKNMIPDMSEFSRSNRSIPLRRKRTSKNKDKEDGSLSRISDDAEIVRGNKTSEKNLVRTKSHDDVKNYAGSDSRIEDGLFALSGNKFEFKSGFSGFSVTHSIKPGSHKKKLGVANEEIPNCKTRDPTKTTADQNKTGVVQSSPIGNANSKQLLSSQVSPPQNNSNAKKGKADAAPSKGANTTTKKEDKNEPAKNAKDKKKQTDNDRETSQEKLRRPAYNKEEMIANFRSLLEIGGVDPKKHEVFDKFDIELGKIVKYVRLEILPTANNDHFISVKPEVLPYKDNQNQDMNKRKFVSNDLGQQQPTKPNYNNSQQMQGGKKAAKAANTFYTNPINGTGGAIPTQHCHNGDVFYSNIDSKLVLGGEASKKPGLTVPNSQGERLNTLAHGQTQKLPVIQADNDLPVLDKSMSIPEQAMHKTMTGKLQRYIKKLSDDEKVAVFKQLKSSMQELLVDQYGRYVMVLFLKTSKLN